MIELSPHMQRARDIVKAITTDGDKMSSTGECMVMLETVVALAILLVSDGRQRMAQGLLDILQDRVSRRMMMNDGKPYD